MDLKAKGMPCIDILEIIFETFSLLKEPIALRDSSLAITSYLEKKGYIITTEFPDPANENKDAILAIPLGWQIKQGTHHFCFDKKHCD